MNTEPTPRSLSAAGGCDPPRQSGSQELRGSHCAWPLAFLPLCPGISNSALLILKVPQETQAHPTVVSNPMFYLLKLQLRLDLFGIAAYLFPLLLFSILHFSSAKHH